MVCRSVTRPGVEPALAVNKLDSLTTKYVARVPFEKKTRIGTSSWNDNEIRDKCVRNGDEEQEV